MGGRTRSRYRGASDRAKHGGCGGDAAGSGFGEVVGAPGGRGSGFADVVEELCAEFRGCILERSGRSHPSRVIVCAWWNAGSRYIAVMKENEYPAGLMEVSADWEEGVVMRMSDVAESVGARGNVRRNKLAWKINHHRRFL